MFRESGKILKENPKSSLLVYSFYKLKKVIKHIKGKENKVVDAINKRVHEFHATSISMDQS
jgi:hypothetical protein